MPKNLEREQALDLCARMSAAEWDEIRICFATMDVEDWVRQGWL